MTLSKGCNPHHPKKGASTKVEPIRSKQAIASIKQRLQNNLRNACFFTLGINTALRANELLSIRVGQVKHLKVGDTLLLKQSKTKTDRRVTLNENAVHAIGAYLRSTSLQEDAYLFKSQRREVLTVPSVNNLVKQWCTEEGLSGNYGSHTLRKTWGYWHYKNNTPLPLLMTAFGHSRQDQTLAYLCIQPIEVEKVYQLAL